MWELRVFKGWKSDLRGKSKKRGGGGRKRAEYSPFSGV